MNGFQWNQIPDPNPLIQHGKYKELPKPTWQVKSIQPSVHSMPYNFKMKFENPSSESEGTLVFQSVQSSSLKEMQQYISYVLGQSLLPDFMKEETNTKNIKFDSYIESGNLHKVYEVYNGEYNLFMNADTNTKGQTRWFYFSVSNASKGQAIRFNICNFNKSVRLFKLGMKPVYLSQKESDENLWKPVSGNIEFYRNSNAIDISKKLYFYTLSFSHTFEHPDDTVFFALSIPYPYTKLLDYLSTLESKLLDPSKISYKREELCKSVGGLSVPKLIITAPKSQGLELYKRKAIVITCRVHPGETAGSCVMEGILEYLVSVSASELRGIYIFYIIPMLNPDGVVCGNSRCGLMGIDLNRRWDSPSDLAHPTIYHCKEMIKAISTKREILMFCDLHGHSKKMNSFIYGCNVAANGGFTSWTKVRLLPRVIAKRSSLFSYPDCRFIVKPDKQGTGRVVVWKEFSITNSFTLETSMFGYKIGDITKSFSQSDYLNIGKETMESISEYNLLLKSIEFELKINGGWLKPIRLKQLTGVLAQDRLEKQYEETKKKNRNFILRNKISIKEKNPDWRTYFTEEELIAAYKRIQTGEDELEIGSSGSDSEPSEDNINEVVVVKDPVFIKKPYTVKAQEIRSHSVASNLPKQENLLDKPKRSSKKTLGTFYPRTSRSVLGKIDDAIRPQTSSKVFFRRESRSGRNTPGLSPIVFNAFRKNLGFYHQMLTTKSNMANGTLEIMCTKIDTKTQKHHK